MSSSEKPPQSLTTPQIVATPSTPGTSPPPSPEEEGALVRPASPPPRIIVLESSHVTRTQSEQLLCTMDTINECEEGESGRRGSAVKISLSEECISTSTVSTPLESSPTSPVQALPPKRCTPYISRYTHVAYSYDCRKQSNSDLQSRLKTRKLLGVGELNGSEETTIYKSKISQLLGINESLYVKLPRGLMYWNSVNTIYFYVFGSMYMVIPSLSAQVEFGIPLDDGAVFGRLYGCVLIILGITFRNFLTERESRADVAFMLLAVAAMHFLQLIVMSASGSLSYLALFIRVAVIAGNLVYHGCVDSQGGLHKQFIRWLDGYTWFNQYHTYESSPARSVIRERLVNAKTMDDDETLILPTTTDIADAVATVATTAAAKVASVVTAAAENTGHDLDEEILFKAPETKKTN